MDDMRGTSCLSCQCRPLCQRSPSRWDSTAPAGWSCACKSPGGGRWPAEKLHCWSNMPSGDAHGRCDAALQRSWCAEQARLAQRPGAELSGSTTHSWQQLAMRRSARQPAAARLHPPTCRSASSKIPRSLRGPSTCAAGAWDPQPSCRSFRPLQRRAVFGEGGQAWALWPVARSAAARAGAAGFCAAPWVAQPPAIASAIELCGRTGRQEASTLQVRVAAGQRRRPQGPPSLAVIIGRSAL